MMDRPITRRRLWSSSHDRRRYQCGSSPNRMMAFAFPARNNGVRASSAPYLLFTDGDCVFPADHLQQHLAVRKLGVAYGGDAVWLSEAASRGVTLATIRSGALMKVVTPAMRRRLQWRAYKSLAYQALRHPSKPRMVGCNMAVHCADLEAINGFDESFVGWGCEDDDFAGRLRRSGVQVRSILHRTHAIHIWHPRHPSRGAKWADSPNAHRLQASKRLVRCVHGLVERDPADLTVRVVNHKCRWFHMAWPKGSGGKSRQPCEVEVMVLPGSGFLFQRPVTGSGVRNRRCPRRVRPGQRCDPQARPPRALRRFASAARPSRRAGRVSIV